MVDTVKFDPGIGEYVIDFNDYVNSVYSQLMHFKNMTQKRARFNLYASKIEEYMLNNISFYLGCLIWANYIVTENEKEPKEIVGNAFLYMTDEQKEDYDYLIQVNFLENYFDSFERDFAYYTGKKKVVDTRWKKILEVYSEFLTLNNGFVSTKMTSDIKLPETIKNIDKNSVSFIEKAIAEKNLALILESDILA